MDFSPKEEKEHPVLPEDLASTDAFLALIRRIPKEQAKRLLLEHWELLLAKKPSVAGLEGVYYSLQPRR
jgi:hypothetical protein